MPIILFIIALGITIAFLIVDKRNKKIVLEKSQRIKSLIELNITLQFQTVQSEYHNCLVCTSKRQLDRLDMDEYLMGEIESREAFYRRIIDAISSNRKEYDFYLTRARAIKSTATEDYCREFGFSLAKFLKYEERVFEKRLRSQPQLDVVVHCKATYTSPQGRNHYEKEKSYSYQKLKDIFEDTIDNIAERQTRQYQIKIERAKMTDSLRYDILQRDDFRCQICGSTQQDGVKLHVDHITPVSKGGLTVPSNLRTLCDRCNMGKRDKM